MILLIDNYDSFTYNVADMLAARGADVQVVRNDEVTVDDVRALEPGLVLLSPGPGRPDDSGVCLDLIRAAGEGAFPLFGICLGMQAIGLAFGARIERLERVVHGQSSPIRHDGAGMFAELPQDFAGGRYHSLVVAEETLPEQLVATAHTDTGVLMGIRHRTLPIEGVQFHPESILTPDGHVLLANCVAAATANLEVA
ncbi:MAG: trpG [Thermoleophilia bacterium]|nr:trpG [Thermoleophilia bacterium]